MSLGVRTCERPGCSEQFEAQRTNHKYHDPTCGRIVANDRRVGGTRAPAELEARDVERARLRLQAAAEAARRAESAARSELAEAREALAEARVELSLYETTANQPAPTWLRAPKDTKNHHGTLVVFLSDTHFGEVVDPGEMNGYNAFNPDIAEQRLERFFQRTALVAHNYLAGVKYDGVVLALGGDLVSGDIHDELTETNAMSTYQTVEWAVPRLEAGVGLLSEEFGKVHVVSAPGNHGRNTRKPKHKRRSANNADTHIARLLSQRFASSSNVTFSVPDSIDVDFSVYGYRFSLEHGDQAKGGDGQVGALGPVKRLALRKQTQLAAEGRPFNYMLVGHFHQLVFGQTQGFVMNGSLKGYDEYARAWHFRPEPAQQALMVCTPEHGITVQAPVIVQKRASEGW